MVYQLSHVTNHQKIYKSPKKIVHSIVYHQRSHPQPSRNAKIDAFQRAIPKGRGAVQERLRGKCLEFTGEKTWKTQMEIYGNSICMHMMLLLESWKSKHKKRSFRGLLW